VAPAAAPDFAVEDNLLVAAGSASAAAAKDNATATVATFSDTFRTTPTAS
jgi:hypothetical protein